MKQQLKMILGRLNTPSVIVSLASQVVQILLLVGIRVNQQEILSIVTALCSIFVALGVLSNPDTEASGYGDDILRCSNTGLMENHVRVAGQMVCQVCGTPYSDSTDSSEAAQ